MAWDRALEDWQGEYEARASRMLELYCSTLEKLGYDPKPYPDMGATVGDSIYGGGKYDVMCHAMWMCTEARRFMAEGRQAKAYRWIGTIQGILWMGGVFTLAELKEHNALPPDAWKKRR